MRHSPRSGDPYIEALVVKVTLQEVAAHASVSRATDSLVLRGTGRVSREMRNRVFTMTRGN
ncbi:LacI family DNA-binding transcriptional regulator [Streptomyces sioyaensis]|uniref:LacI family DNA-binding transcriptional regulator n=1 Tax=Streptomyces sioyaensis TaxID=67364 RepID=UPI0033F7519C